MEDLESLETLALKTIAVKKRAIGLRDIGSDLGKFRLCLDAAQAASLDIESSYEFYVLAFLEYSRSNVSEALGYYHQAKEELGEAVDDAKSQVGGFRVHNLRTLSFIFSLYGLYTVAYASAFALVLYALLYPYGSLRILDIPLWSSLEAGIGASAYLLVGLFRELRREGLVTTYRRGWYVALPVVGMVVGYLVYALLNSGMVVPGGAGRASEMGAITSICFAAGFMAGWIVDSPIRQPQEEKGIIL